MVDQTQVGIIQPELYKQRNFHTGQFTLWAKEQTDSE